MISTTVAGLLQEYFKTSERTVFWDDALKANVDPFQDMPNGFFAAEWDLKVCLRDFFSYVIFASSLYPLPPPHPM